MSGLEGMTQTQRSAVLPVSRTSFTEALGEWIAVGNSREPPCFHIFWLHSRYGEYREFLAHVAKAAPLQCASRPSSLRSLDSFAACRARRPCGGGATLRIRSYESLNLVPAIVFR
jgi:hypothetical protein